MRTAKPSLPRPYFANLSSGWWTADGGDWWSPCSARTRRDAAQTIGNSLQFIRKRCTNHRHATCMVDDHSTTNKRGRPGSAGSRKTLPAIRSLMFSTLAVVLEPRRPPTLERDPTVHNQPAADTYLSGGGRSPPNEVLQTPQARDPNNIPRV
jgi:hypothetical protein